MNIAMPRTAHLIADELKDLRSLLLGLPDGIATGPAFGCALWQIERGLGAVEPTPSP